MDKGFAFASKQTENIAAFHSRKMTNKKAVLDVNLSYFVSLGKRWSIMSWQTCYYGEINKDHLKRNTNGPWKLLTPAVGEWWITLIWVGTDWLWLFCEITAAVIFRGIIMREKHASGKTRFYCSAGAHIASSLIETNTSHTFLSPP